MIFQVLLLFLQTRCGGGAGETRDGETILPLGHDDDDDDDDAFHHFSGWSTIRPLCSVDSVRQYNQNIKGYRLGSNIFPRVSVPKCNKSCRIFYRISIPVGLLIKPF